MRLLQKVWAIPGRIVEEFAAARIPFVVIDEKESNVRACIEHGYLALQGDASSDDLLREAGIEHAKCVLVATDDDARNISITLSARHLNSKLFIVARVVGKTLVEAQNILSYGARIVALKRPSGLMPGSRSEARIEAGDTVIAVGAPEQLTAFQQKNNAHPGGS